MNKNLDLKEIFKVANENHRNGEFEAAEEIYIKILDSNPNHFETIFYLSALLLQLKRFSEAKIYITKALKIEPNNVDLKDAMLNNITLEKKINKNLLDKKELQYLD